MVGPIQQDLLLIILFRNHSYVVGTDIAMIYRQVLIELQRVFQRIFWKKSLSDPITTYKLNTIINGMASSFHGSSSIFQKCSK